MKKYKLHTKQKEFLKRYLNLFNKSNHTPSDDNSWEAITDIVWCGYYSDLDRPFLNSIRKRFIYLMNNKPLTIGKPSGIHQGYVFAPYNPMYHTPNVSSAGSFTSPPGIMKRYSAKKVNKKYYGTIKCDNIT